MNVNEINSHLNLGHTSIPGLFPHLEDLENGFFRFKVDFGLRELPEEGGLIVIRGARQFGKSTWLESQIKQTLQKYGPGSAYYLNGDFIQTEADLELSIRNIVPLYSGEAKIKRLFIDEITSVVDWEKPMKRLLDAGELRGVLIVTTGSKAVDLRRGTERLPGRKGKLARTSYYFTPISYSAFKKVCGDEAKDRALWIYLLSGGSPLALAELVQNQSIPEYVVEMTRDWIFGELALANRSRSSLLPVLEVLFNLGGTPIGQSKLAKESGLANNTVANGYVELLADLQCLGSCYYWDANEKIRLHRKPRKYPFINLLTAVSWHKSKMRRVEDFLGLPEQDQGIWLEWLVAQEIWRRNAIRGESFPEEMQFWQSKEHELDFAFPQGDFLEVKRGAASPLDFSWFSKVFPKGKLTVVNKNNFSTQNIQGITMEDFLLDGVPSLR